MSWMDWLLDLLFIDCFADWLVWLIYQPWSTLIGWLVGNWWFDWLVCWLIWRLCDWHWLQFEFMYWFMDLLICCWLLLYAIALLISWSVDLLIYSIVHRHIIKWLICLLSVQSSNVHWFLDLLIRSNIYLFMAANLLGGKKTAALAIRGNIWRHSSFCEDLHDFHLFSNISTLSPGTSTETCRKCSQRKLLDPARREAGRFLFFHFAKFEMPFQSGRKLKDPMDQYRLPSTFASFRIFPACRIGVSNWEMQRVEKKEAWLNGRCTLEPERRGARWT